MPKDHIAPELLDGITLIEVHKDHIASELPDGITLIEVHKDHIAPELPDGITLIEVHKDHIAPEFRLIIAINPLLIQIPVHFLQSLQALG